MNVADLLDEPGFLLGLRYIEPGSTVPMRPHHHELKQANYVLEGDGIVTNGKDKLSFGAGDFLLFESNEEHYFETRNGIRMLEIVTDSNDELPCPFGRGSLIY